MTDQGHSGTVVIREYAKRRLYDKAAGAYLSRDDLAAMAREGARFVVLDAETGEDVTGRVMAQ